MCVRARMRGGVLSILVLDLGDGAGAVGVDRAKDWGGEVGMGG